MNSDPVIDERAGSAVWVTDWRFFQGSGVRQAEIVPFKLDLNTGALLNGIVMGQPAVLLTQQYPLSEVSEPIMPEGVFSADGAFFTIPLLSDDGMGNLRTTVLSCSTAFGNCEGAARRWTSPTFFGMLRAVVPFSQGNIYAAIGPTRRVLPQRAAGHGDEPGRAAAAAVRQPGGGGRAAGRGRGLLRADRA